MKEYQVDAAVIHGIKSCRSFTAGQGDLRDWLIHDQGLPTLYIESDHQDPRYFAAAQIKNRMDAFFESLEQRRAVAAATSGWPPHERVVAGVDIGSTTAKCVILGEDARGPREVAEPGRRRYREGRRDAPSRRRSRTPTCARSDVSFITGTGYGRYKVYFGQLVVTEISCHARGAHFLFPGTRLVVDIGGQDTKAIRINDKGEVVDFAMNDKCAAGTGRFLEVCANALGYDVGEIGPLSLQARHAVKVTSTCTVFAESEVTSYVSRGKDPKDILAGLHASIANRTLSLMQRVGVEPEITFTGGVSQNEGMVHALHRRLGAPVNVSPLSQYLGALGAALHGRERLCGRRLVITGRPRPRRRGRSRARCSRTAGGSSPLPPPVAGIPGGGGARHVLEELGESREHRARGRRLPLHDRLRSRYTIPERNLQVSDFTSSARGAVFLFPKTRLVVDVGTQASRTMSVSETGKVLKFKMNEKCAAGAGRFVERCSKYLQVPLEEMGPKALASEHPKLISSVCAVLAETGDHQQHRRGRRAAGHPDGRLPLSLPARVLADALCGDPAGGDARRGPGPATSGW